MKNKIGILAGAMILGSALSKSKIDGEEPIIIDDEKKLNPERIRFQDWNKDLVNYNPTLFSKNRKKNNKKGHKRKKARNGRSK